MAKEWIVWKGGDCPVDPDVRVSVKLRNGTKDTGLAKEFLWGHVDGRTSGARLDIVFYREVRQ